MKSRKVQTKLWRDNWFCSLNSNSKLLFLYLITNEFVGLSGYVELSDRQICFDTGLTQKELDTAKIDLSAKVSFFEGWIHIKNLLKHDPIRGENNTLWKTLQAEIDRVPKEIKDQLDAPLMGDASPKHGRIGIGIGKGIRGGVGEIEKEVKNDRTDLRGIEKSLKDNLPLEEMKKIAEDHRVPVDTVSEKKQDYVLWIQEKPTDKKRHNRNMKATVTNWLRRDLKSGKIKKTPLQPIHNPIHDLPEISQEQRIENLKRIQQIKQQFGRLQ